MKNVANEKRQDLGKWGPWKRLTLCSCCSCCGICSQTITISHNPHTVHLAKVTRNILYKLDKNIYIDNGSLQTFYEILNYYVEAIFIVLGQSTSWLSHIMSWITVYDKRIISFRLNISTLHYKLNILWLYQWFITQRCDTASESLALCFSTDHWFN